jgi:hypothetical protein
VIWRAPWGEVSLNLPGALKRSKKPELEGYVELAKGTLEECQDAITVLKEENRKSVANLSLEEMETALKNLAARNKLQAAQRAAWASDRERR